MIFAFPSRNIMKKIISRDLIICLKTACFDKDIIIK